MTEENTNAAPKTRKARKARKPKLKDWIRVLKSTGNGCENTEVILRINEATGLVQLITNAPKAEDSNEAEGQRVQVFKITGLDVFSDANDDPLAEQEAPAASNDDSGEAAPESQPAETAAE